MNELMAALIIIVLMLWLLYDRAKHPHKYIQAYVELEAAIEAFKLVLGHELLPALESAVEAMQQLVENVSELSRSE